MHDTNVEMPGAQQHVKLNEAHCDRHNWKRSRSMQQNGQHTDSFFPWLCTQAKQHRELSHYSVKFIGILFNVDHTFKQLQFIAQIVHYLHSLPTLLFLRPERLCENKIHIYKIIVIVISLFLFFSIVDVIFTPYGSAKRAVTSQLQSESS